MIVPATKHYRTIPEHCIVNNLPGNAQVLLSDFHYLCNKRTKQLNPKIQTLAQRHGWSYSKAARALRKLRDAGIIRSVRCKLASTYEIRPTAEWRTPPDPPAPKSRSVKSDRSEMTELKPPFLIERETSFFEREGGSSAASAAHEGTSSVAAADASTPTVKTTNQAVLSETPVQPAPATGGGDPPWEDMAASLVDELYQSHPKPGHRSRSIPILAGILRRSGAPEATADQIRASHTQWLRYWAYEPARALHLWFWFESKEYLDPPAEAAIKAAHMKSMSFKELEQYRKLLTMNAEIDAKIKRNVDQDAKDAEFLEKCIKQGRIIK